MIPTGRLRLLRAQGDKMQDLPLEHSYAENLVGFYAQSRPARAPSPQLLVFNQPLAQELGLDGAALAAQGATLFSGNDLPANARPIALAYAGHQFGGFSPQLGDGRALLWGEVIDRAGQRRDLAFKGSGPTPFSRGGDGFAALGPVLREYIMGEGMHALGLPTTRVLACVSTGAKVRRETMLDGAILTRIALSHLRVGTFQFFAAKGERNRVRQLADYTIARHYPKAMAAPNRYLALFDAVATAQVQLVARWMSIGFIHGVMNTDNMALSGETIDYGPCAFMETYDPETVFSSIDRQGRYAYANQPTMMGWNLARFAETLLELIEPDQDRAIDIATQRLEGVAQGYEVQWQQLLGAKLGLARADTLGVAYLDLLLDAKVDFTQGFYALRLAQKDATLLESLFAHAPQGLEIWLRDWRAALGPTSQMLMERANPLYIARNHLVEEALAAAQSDDLAPLTALVQVLQNPYDFVVGQERYAAPAPQGFGAYRTFCGT